MKDFNSKFNCILTDMKIISTATEVRKFVLNFPSTPPPSTPHPSTPHPLNPAIPQLTSMQKAYHDLKEQALRMSIEQDAQKDQIEEEIKKLKVSNHDLIKKNKVSRKHKHKTNDFRCIITFGPFVKIYNQHPHYFNNVYFSTQHSYRSSVLAKCQSNITHLPPPQDSKAEAVVSTIMELEKLYSNRITALEKALNQKDEMVTDLEEQNRNMVQLRKHFVVNLCQLYFSN